MQIVKITGTSIENIKTTIVGDYHNIRHGIKAKGFWSVSIGVSTNIADVNMNKESKDLVGSSFDLSPIYRNDEHLKDRKGNYMYFLDYGQESVNEYIVAWDIPNKRYVDVKYSLSGMVEVLSEGSTGTVRAGKKFSSPAPILEVRGPAILSWTGVRSDDVKIKQTIKFDGGKWEVSPIEIVSDTGEEINVD